VGYVRTNGGYTRNVSGVVLGTGATQPLWFDTPMAKSGTYSAEDLELVLVLVREDGYVYWATKVLTSAP
jgi:hypothetical protein